MPGCSVEPTSCIPHQSPMSPPVVAQVATASFEVEGVPWVARLLKAAPATVDPVEV